MTSLLLEGDADAIAHLVDRMFNVPAGRDIQYRSFGAHVMMMMGNFKRITSLTQPFDRWGAVRETQSSFWIPVLAGRDFGGIFIAERLLMAVPYVFVDNRPVGGWGEVRALESSGVLEHLVRGEV